MSDQGPKILKFSTENSQLEPVSGPMPARGRKYSKSVLKLAIWSQFPDQKWKLQVFKMCFVPVFTICPGICLHSTKRPQSTRRIPSTLPWKYIMHQVHILQSPRPTGHHIHTQARYTTSRHAHHHSHHTQNTAEISRSCPQN